MAGASRFPGFTLMAVRGEVTSAAMAASGASFSGAGVFQTGNQGGAPATFQVEVTAGGPALERFGWALLTPFVLVLPTEEVLTAGSASPEECIRGERRQQCNATDGFGAAARSWCSLPR
jgi:hypothetical protein